MSHLQQSTEKGKTKHAEGIGMSSKKFLSWLQRHTGNVKTVRRTVNELKVCTISHIAHMKCVHTLVLAAVMPYNNSNNRMRACA